MIESKYFKFEKLVVAHIGFRFRGETKEEKLIILKRLVAIIQALIQDLEAL